MPCSAMPLLFLGRRDDGSIRYGDTPEPEWNLDAEADLDHTDGEVGAATAVVAGWILRSFLCGRLRTRWTTPAPAFGIYSASRLSVSLFTAAKGIVDPHIRCYSLNFVCWLKRCSCVIKWCHPPFTVDQFASASGEHANVFQPVCPPSDDLTVEVAQIHDSAPPAGDNDAAGENYRSGYNKLF